MIILLTDFGQSEYVGVMKGVIYTIYDNAKIVDLCHNISAQGIVKPHGFLRTTTDISQKVRHSAAWLILESVLKERHWP